MPDVQSTKLTTAIELLAHATQACVLMVAIASVQTATTIQLQLEMIKLAHAHYVACTSFYRQRLGSQRAAKHVRLIKQITLLTQVVSVTQHCWWTETNVNVQTAIITRTQLPEIR